MVDRSSCQVNRCRLSAPHDTCRQPVPSSRDVYTQILNLLDVALPAEKDRWWRSHVDGETPHLFLLSSTSLLSRFRGPVWTEVRYTSGKPVKARVLVSAQGDFLVEMEVMGADGTTRIAAGSTGSLSPGTLLRIEVRAQDLRKIFRSTAWGGVESGMESEVGKGAASGRRQTGWLLAPGRRLELCR